jgi:hypothetical protein
MFTYKWLIPLIIFILSMIALLLGCKVGNKQAKKEGEEKKHMPHWKW